MAQVPRETIDGPAVTDEEIWLEASDRLRFSIESNQDNIPAAIDDLEFEDGNQWPADLYNQRRINRRPALTINMTRRCVREVCNNMRQQRPRIKVHPTGGGSRVETAKMVQGIIRNIEEDSKASVAYDTAGESAVKIGWGYLRVVSEWLAPNSFMQKLKIKAIRNPFTVYDDPNAQLPTGADRNWCIITEEMSREMYKRMYPKATNAEWKKRGPGDEDHLWESKEKIRLAEYFRVKKTKDTLYELTDGRAMYASEYAKAKEALTMAGITIAVYPPGHAQAGEEKKRVAFRREIEWFKLNGREIVDRRTIPGKVGFIPIIRCEGNVLDLNGKIRRRGMIRDLKDSNRMLNYWATCETELVALAPRAPFIAAEGQLDGHPEWKDANQKPYSALVYKPVHTNPENPESQVLPPPMRQEAVQVPAGVVNARQGALQDLMALAGMPHDPRADVPGAVVSGKALRERQGLTDRSHFQYYDNQTMAIAHVGEIIVDQLPFYYSEARIQRIIGDDGIPSMVNLNEQVTDPQTGQIEVKNDMRMGEYDIVMDTGPGYETKRQEGQEAVLDLLKTPLAEPIVKTGADLIVRNMDFAGADDLADRLLPTNPQGMQKALQSLPKEAQGIVQGLMTQLQQAQQVIQQQALEIKFKGGIEQMRQGHEDRRHASTLAKDVHDTDTRARTEIQRQAMQDTTARDVAEIGAAAKIVDSHVKGAHDAAIARETAKAASKAEKGNGSG